MTKIDGVEIIHNDDVGIEILVKNKHQIKVQVGGHVIWWYESDLTIYDKGADILYIRSVFWNDRLKKIDLVNGHVFYGNYKYLLAERI
jgi:hypothetical protein